MAEAPDYLTSRRVRELLAAHGLEAHKTLGQNFLVDPNTVRRIVDLAGVGPGDQVIEIGPGLGSLSVGLVAAGVDLRLVELDTRLVAPLRDVLGEGVDLIVGDARTLDWTGIATPGTWTVVANLPYNVAATVVLRILETAPTITRLVVMVQREVAERLCAGPGKRTYGIPSVKVRFWGSARIVAAVGRDVFVPRPRVDSAVVEIRRGSGPSRPDHEAVFSLVNRAFGQRRKMLSTSLRGVVDAEGFEEAGVEGSARPETLDVDEWCRLASVAR